MAKKILVAKGSTIKVQVKVKGKKKELPDWGLGTGILAEQKFTIGADVTKDNKVSFYLKRDEIYQQLLEEVLEPLFTVENN